VPDTRTRSSLILLIQVPSVEVMNMWVNDALVCYKDDCIRCLMLFLRICGREPISGKLDDCDMRHDAWRGDFPGDECITSG